MKALTETLLVPTILWFYPDVFLIFWVVLTEMSDGLGVFHASFVDGLTAFVICLGSASGVAVKLKGNTNLHVQLVIFVKSAIQI